MDSCETARYSLFRSQPNRVQFARLRAAPSILHINGTPGTGRLLSPEYNDQNITNGGPPCSSSVYSFKRPRSIYVGIGVHCAQDSGICAQSTHARPDLLPDEPGDYSDFNGLFGAKYVNPVIKPSGPMTDLDGTVIQDATGHIGFPGFDGMEATVSLAWVAQMQEAGIPVTYAYI